MRRQGFITQIILLLIIISAAILINKLFAKEPNRYSQQAVKSVAQYPNSINWQVSNKPKLCIYYLNRCHQITSTITFNTHDRWADIYMFYREKLNLYGWQTKSNIVTSIPTSIVLKNEILFDEAICELVAKEKGRNLFNIASETGKDTFIIEIWCTPI